MKKIKRDILLLGLIFIILFIITASINTASALDEVQDDYLNETRIQIKENMVRNPILNAMELDYYNITGWGVDMDIWESGGYTRVEQGIQHIKNINGTSIWFDNVDRDEGDRIFKDFGANYFDGNFEYVFRVKISSSRISNARCIFMMFSETNEDQTDMITNDRDWLSFFIQWKDVGSMWDLDLRSWDEGVVTLDRVSTDDVLDMDKWYHVSYVRNGDNVTAWFYNDVLMNDLDFMLTVVDSGVSGLRYFHPLNSQDQASGGRAMDLWLNKVRNYTALSGYVNDGYFYTVEMLSNLNGSTVVLLTNATIPISDSIKVEFSSDASTWVDHNGNVGFDLLVAGNESLDLRDLGYTDLHVRYNFSDGGADSTPRLYQMIVITSDVIIGDNGEITIIDVPLIVFGLTVGLIIGLGLKSK